MPKFLDNLPIVLDGAMGTRLQMLGMPAGVCTPAWILDHPETFLTVKRSYIDAGSDAIYAPTFGAIGPELKKHRIAMSVREMNRNLVELAREEANNCFVGGDIAPCGLQLYPVGTATFDDLIEVFTEQAAALEEAGVDFFAVETQMSLAECRTAVVAVRSVSDKPIIASFTCGNTGRTLYGEDLSAALVCLQDMGVSAFGINCCGDLNLIARLLGKMKPYAAIPLIAKPNAGEPVSSNGHSVYRMNSAKMSAYIPRFVANGARLLGGCCGTDESYIAAVHETLSAMDVPPFAPAGPRAVAASAYRVQELTPRIRIEELEIDDDIVENASVIEAMGAKMLRLELRDELDLDTLSEAQFSVRLPLVLHCTDEELLKKFLRIYNGKPVVL
jgi:Methionine synthase I (cobalamin-dependent), methyltransferase domain